MTSHVVLVDDDEDLCRAIADDLERASFRVTWRTDPEDAFRLVCAGDVDVVVTDLKMRGMNGVELCRRIVDNRPDVPVIAITGFGSMESAVATLRAGAFDFLTKPFDVGELVVSIERAVADRQLRAEVKRLRRMVEETRTVEDIVGDSPEMRRLFELIDQVAASDATALVTGETGSGKELVARAIHRRSRRGNGPLVSVNCAALPESLLESELFGHVRGAFTDAREDRRGLFVGANGGTIFLDEIGEMSPSVQAKLLRVLEARRVRPVGASEEIPVDVRVIAATNRDLMSCVEQGQFREDLYYRIHVLEVPIPPLRSRGSDVLLIAQTLLEQIAGRMGKDVRRISAPVAERFLAYAWPGNVRELRNCIERAVALAQHDELIVEDLPERIRTYSPSDVIVAGSDPEEMPPLAEVEKRYVLRVLEMVGGNKRQAARILGVDRTTLYRKLERYGIVEGS